MNSPVVRLVARALIAFVSTVAVQLQQSHGWDTAVIEGAIVGGVLAGLEVLTPVNATVGPAKAGPAKP